VVFRFCDLENIEYLVLRYLNTGTLPCEEFSEEWLFDGEGTFSSILAMVVGDGLIWKLVQDAGKWLSFRKKRGEKEKLDRRLSLIQYMLY
jgi:hypothetical protein